MNPWKTARKHFAGALSDVREGLVDANGDALLDTDILGVELGGQIVISIDLNRPASYSIGADPGCDIQLPSGPAYVGHFVVKATGKTIWFISREDEGQQPSPSDASARVTVDVGNTLEVAGYTLAIVDPRPLHERVRSSRFRWVRGVWGLSRLIQPTFEWLPRQRRALGAELAKAATGGFTDWEALLRKLSVIAHESEATLAEAHFRRGRRVLLGAVVAYALLCAAIVGLFATVTGVTAPSLMWLLFVATLLCSVLTSSYAAAGTTLFVAGGGAIFGALGPGLESQLRDISADAGFMLAYCALGGFLGYQLEMAWSPVPNSVRSKHFGGWGFAVAIFLWLSWTESQLMTWGRSGAAALIILWSTVGMAFARRRFHREIAGDAPRHAARSGTAAPTVDTIILLDTAWTFWRRQMLYRLVGIGLAAFTLLGLVNWTVVAERLEQHRFIAGKNLTIVWWQRPSNSTRPRRYHLADASRLGQLHGVTRTGQRVEADPESVANAVFYSSEDVQQVLSLAKANTYPDAALWCEEQSDGSTLSRLVLTKCYDVEMSEAEVAQTLQLLFALRLPAALLVGFGLLVLWRATGEPGSLPVALWALGFAASPALVFMVSPTFSIDELLVHWGLSGLPDVPFVDMAHVWVRALSLLGLLLAVISAVGIFSTAAVLSVVWPPHRDADSRFSRRSVMTWLVVVIAVPILAAAATWSISMLMLRIPGAAAFSWLMFSGILLSPVVAPPLVGWFITRKRPGTVPYARSRAGLLSIPGVILAAVTFTVAGPLPTSPALWLIYALTAVLFSGIAYELFERKLWNLAGAQTVAAVVTVVVLPIAGAWLENTSEDVFKDLSLVSPAAARLITIMIALAVSRPLYEAMKKLVEWRTVSGNVRAAAEKIPQFIEVLLADPGGGADDLSRLLQQDMELREYVLFRRKGPNDFERLLAEGSTLVPGELTLSRELLSRLGKLPGFLDLRLGVYDMKLVTIAPELWRLHRRLSRSYPYLLPINVGGIPYGLLFIAAGLLPDALRSESIIEKLQALGIATTRSSKAPKTETA